MNNVVQKNINIEENTFIFLLHERDDFDAILFCEYIKNVALVNSENTGRNLIISLIETNDYIIRNFLYHFLPEDLFVMKNIPVNISDYVELIQIENQRLLREL